MANSPSCSSTSPSASTATNVTDLQEADAFSDDSGVDVKPQITRYLQFPRESAAEASKRNKRKSSEPKKRKDVLLMKRFRWDSDEEDRDEEDVFDVLEGERPSSGDSGCQLDSSARLSSQEKKKKQRQWRKPKTETIQGEEDLSQPPFRQSVICKNEATTTAPPTCTGISATLHHQDTPPLVSPLANTLAKKTPNSQVNASAGPSRNCDAVLDGDDARSSRGANAMGGRPRNYKNMNRQRRIEANARERTRVHTISAAFESLRRAVPAYAHNQKLSKLAILRIASAYIVALACLNGQPEGPQPPAMAECVEKCTRTIQAEGRSRRRTSKD